MQFKYMNTKTILALMLATFVFAGCKDKEEDYADLKESIILNYANIVEANYKDAYDYANIMKTAINDFVANPTSTTHQAAKDAWLAAREPYGQTEAFRFGEGPIDDADGPEGAINAWPLDENYIDYVTGNPTSGIINDTTVAISAADLIALNEAGGEANISLGFHAIEFLLWGQDSPDASLFTTGQRPYTDYVVGGGGTAANQARRGLYLQTVATILVDNLAELLAEWTPGSTSNYRATFLALEQDEALRRMLTGIGVLCKSELAGERMFTALDNQSQEDEHSCFSDNTHRDIILNFQGISNVYNGKYTRVSGGIVQGASLANLGTEIDYDLNTDVLIRITNVNTRVHGISAPFDHALTQETVGGNGSIQLAVNEMQALGDKFAEMATKMGITISTALPD